MKLNGIVFSAPIIKVLPIVRDTETYFFQCQAVTDFDDFDRICPEPVPPCKEVPGVGRVDMLDDPEYKAQVAKRSLYFTDFLIIKSLEATPGLVWDTVDLNDITTYGNFRRELLEAHLTLVEVSTLIQTAMEANSLDEAKIDKAREDFLTGRRSQPKIE